MNRLLLCLAGMASLLVACQNNSSPKTMKSTSWDDIPNRKWWKEAVVYQVYPRSFKDSDGDGIGDPKRHYLPLTISKSLGVDVVWLNPIFASPIPTMAMISATTKAS